MTDDRKKILADYATYICKTNAINSIVGDYIKCVTIFLEQVDSINRRGYQRYKKEHSGEFVDHPRMSDAVCDFLSYKGIGYQRHIRAVKPLEKLSVISEKNQKLINAYIADMRENYDYSPRTVEIHYSALKQFYAHCNDFTMENCKRFLKTLEEKGRSPKTIRVRITAFERYGRFMKKPVMLKRPKIVKSLDTDNVPTEAEYNKLLNYLTTKKNKDYYFFVKVLGTTGARLTEFFQFTWEDILKGEVTLRGKGNKYRRFFFQKQLQQEVRDYVKDTGKTGLIAIGKYGAMTQRGLDANLKTWGEKCGIDRRKMHAHAFRHFFAKMFLKKNKDIIQLADLLGHGSVDTTRIYLQRSYGEQKRDFNKNVTW